MNGRTLRKHRQDLGMTQAELADALGVATNTVARYERNELNMSKPVVKLVQLLVWKRGRE